MQYEESSGNVFEDLEIPNSTSEQIRSALACEIFKIIDERKLKQREIAAILHIDQPEVSKLKNSRFDQFSVERLFSFLNRLDCDITISITKHSPKAKSAAGMFVNV